MSVALYGVCRQISAASGAGTVLIRQGAQRDGGCRAQSGVTGPPPHSNEALPSHFWLRLATLSCKASESRIFTKILPQMARISFEQKGPKKAKGEFVFVAFVCFCGVVFLGRSRWRILNP